MYQPSGLTGQVECGGKTFRLQTEFLERPQPRIVTSVFCEGQVVYKVAAEWDKDLEDTGLQAELDLAIQKQHADAVAKIGAEGERLWDEAAKHPPATQKVPLAVATVQLEEKLKTTPGLVGLIVASYEGKVLNQAELAGPTKSWATLVAELAGFAGLLAKATRLGSLVEGTAEFPEGKLVVSGQPETVVGIVVKTTTDTQQAKDNLKLALQER